MESRLELVSGAESLSEFDEYFDSDVDCHPDIIGKNRHDGKLVSPSTSESGLKVRRALECSASAPLLQILSHHDEAL